MPLANKTALITGGASGIGYAIAARFAESGARIILTDINRELGEKVEKSFGNARFIEADASRRSDILTTVEQAIEIAGKIDILVNNAGIVRHRNALDITPEIWEMNVNLMYSGVFYYMQEIGRHMIATGGGSIVNIASMNAELALPGRVAYSSCKAAVISMTRTLAAEWAPHRIRVNAVSPGITMTNLTEEAFKAGISDRQTYLSRIPLGRMAMPEEIAGACLFIASDEASYMTGHNLVVDGGWTSYNWTDIDHEDRS